MSSYGKTIRIYLKDRTATGIKICELVNSTIQAISCPRTRIAELRNMVEATRPAVYFLFGYDELNGKPKVYIGEAENIGSRLQQQFDKPFWHEAIFFGSKDLNITKAHVRHLESKLIQLALSATRYEVENGNSSQASSLSLPDVDAMEEFLENLKLMLGTLGHNLLEPLLQPKVQEIFQEQLIANIQNEEKSLNGTKLFLTVKNVRATAILTDEGIVVLRGSQAALSDQPSLSNGYKKIKENLIESKILIRQSNHYIFEEDFLFKTASPAAAIIVGTAINGPNVWKNEQGSTLNDLEK